MNRRGIPQSPYQTAFEHLMRQDKSLAGLIPRARHLLEVVCESQVPLTIIEVAKRMHIDPTGVSRLSIKLNEFELIKRELAPEDSRKTLISATPKARAIDRRVRASVDTSAVA